MNRIDPIPVLGFGARVTAHCLGRFRIEDTQGGGLQLRSRKARAMIAHLLLSRSPVSRERLADLLWSDRGVQQARGSLRQVIFDIRRLGDQLGTNLISTGEEIRPVEGVLVTDLDQIRQASEVGDHGRLIHSLREAEAGLLLDLDGLDSEYDDWLRAQRTIEPARTLSAAIAFADDLRGQGDLHAAQAVVAEILRIDPTFEEAVRLALRIDHALGDTGALGRRMRDFREILSRELSVEPSRQTIALYEELKKTSPWNAPSDGGADASMGKPAADNYPAHRISSPWRYWPAALCFLILAGLVAAFAWQGRDRANPASAADKALIAVLPFEGRSNDDKFFADGLWEDTRTALSQNGAVRVLGRASTNALVGAQASPDSYWQKLGVTHLLEGSVRRAGDQARIVVTLTRTDDGVALWHGRFDGGPGDTLSMQDSLARAIEGRLRGQLAPGGGRQPSQIVTRPEVYALYSEARSLLRDRRGDDARRARTLLLQAVAKDPNFAPAWSSLGTANYFIDLNPAGVLERNAESRQHIRRALRLAPNLAEAHAALAFVEGFHSPAGGAALKRAVELDPGNAEAWNWLGNAANERHRLGEAQSWYRKAVDIDPLWGPPLQNLASTLVQRGNVAGARRLMDDTRRAGGSPALLDAINYNIALLEGDYSSAVGPLLSHGRRRNISSTDNVYGNLAEGLTALGLFDEAGAVLGFPDWYGPVLRSERLPPERIRGRRVTDADFWDGNYLPSFGSRAMLNLDRGDLLVGRYRGAFRDADAFISAMTGAGTLELVAPNVAIALKRSGSREADYLMSSVARPLEAADRTGRAGREAWWRLARIRAVQDRPDEAIRLLVKAFRAGWLPSGWSCSIDLAHEPAFHSLRGDRRFEVIRRAILKHVARERRELGPVYV